MAYMSAREMLSGLPVKMARGGYTNDYSEGMIIAKGWATLTLT
jgi:hypothetical protein